MDRDEALRLLKGGKEGVREWNKRHEAWWETLEVREPQKGARLGVRCR